MLKLSQVYGVIAYYVENGKPINDYVAEGDRELEQSAIPLSQTNPDLFARLEAARRQIASKANVTVRFLADEDLDADIFSAASRRRSSGPRPRAMGEKAKITDQGRSFE